MKWRMCELIELRDGGLRDEMGNRVLEKETLGTARVRMCPPGVLATSNEGNDYKAGDMTIITIAPLKIALRASYVRFPSVDPDMFYEVIHVSDLGRRRILSLKKQKGAKA